MNPALDAYLDDLMGLGATTAEADGGAPATSTVSTPAPEAPTVPVAVSVRPVPGDTPTPRAPEPNPLLPGHPVVRGPAPDERRRRADERFTSWLRFEVSGQPFAVEVLKVQEVMRLPDILPLRGTPAWMLGMMNLRGQIVPVTDLAVRLGLQPRERGAAARVIVLEQRGEAMGLLVDAVADVHPVSDAMVEGLQGPLAGPEAVVIRGISRRGGLTVTLLDADVLLG